jgi:tetratricopeptide (TPR) repeat protein
MLPCCKSILGWGLMGRYLLFGVISLLLAGLSLTAAAPGLVGGDAPELASAAFHLGSAHAPGYPLFVVLGHLFQLLPLGTPAFRLTFFSITVQSMTFLVLASTLTDLWEKSPRSLPGLGEKKERETYAHLVPAILAASLVMAGPLVFHQTVSPEVFALHLLFVALFLRFLLSIRTTHFLTGAFLAGVSLSHHHLTLLILPALLWAYRDYLRKTKLLWMAATFSILGLSVYLVLPLRAVRKPLVNWGNPATFQQFLYHFTRTQYGGDITSGSLFNGFQDLGFYLQKYAMELYGVGLLFTLLGLFKNRGGLKGGYYLGAGCLLVLLPFLIRAPGGPEDHFVNQPFLVPAILWFSPLVLKGMQWTLEQLKNCKALAAGSLPAFLGLVVFLSYGQNDASRNLAVEDVAKDMLRQMPSRSVLYSEGDSVTFPLAYLNLVMGLRPDLTFFDRTGGLFEDLYHLLDYRKSPGLSSPQMVDIEESFEREKRPTAVFYTEKNTVPGRSLAMNGLLFQSIDGEASLLPPIDLWTLFRPPRIGLNHDYLSRESAARFYLFRAGFYLDLDNNIPEGQKDIHEAKSLAFDNSRLLVNAGVLENANGWNDQAELTFDKACELTPDFYLAWLDRGIVAAKQKHNGEAIVYFKKAAELAPGIADIHQHLAYQYYQARKFSEAVEEWEMARKVDPGYPDAYRNLGYFYMQTNPAYAAEMFKRYLELMPSAPDRFELEKWLGRPY